MKTYTVLFLWISLLTGFSSCYTFKDISIKPDVSRFMVEDFTLAANAPAGIEQQFTEGLKNRVLRETRLQYDENDPHILFEGTITSFSVISTATDAQNTASLNKLEIRIRIKYTNILHEEENWENTFTEFATFDRDQNLSDVQDDKIEEIYDLILESVINKAFSNW